MADIIPLDQVYDDTAPQQAQSLPAFIPHSQVIDDVTPQAQPLSGLETLAGGIADIGNKMTLGGAGKLIGAGAGLTDYLGAKLANVLGGDVPVPDLIDASQARTQQISDLASQYQTEHPISSAYNNVAAFNMPLPSDAIRAGVAAGNIAPLGMIGKAALTTLEGTGLGGASGFINTDGNLQDRLQGAQQGANIGTLVGGGAAGLGAAAEGVGNFLDTLGGKFQLGSLGIRGSDAKQALQRLPRTTEGAIAENPLLTAISDIKSQGGFANGMEPQDLLATLRSQVVDRGNQVTNLIKSADGAAVNSVTAPLDEIQASIASKITGAPVEAGTIANNLAVGDRLPSDWSPTFVEKMAGVKTLPDFNSTGSFINGLKGTAQKQATSIYQREVGALIDTLDNGGTLSDWQTAKQSLQGQLESSYSKANPTLKGEVQQRIASDIRQHIENQSALLNPETAGKIGQLNKEMGQRLQLDKIVSRSRAANDVSTPVKSLMAAMRTSGGFGVPALLTYQDTHSIPKAIGAGLAGALLTSPGGQYKTGQALQGLGSIADRLSVGSGGLGALVTQALTASSSSSTQGQTLNKMQPLTVQKSLPSVNPAPTVTPSQAKSADTVTPQLYHPASVQGLIAQQHPLVQAVIKVESGGNPNAVSPTGVRGLMQLTSATARDMGVTDRTDPAQSVQGGTKYLSQMLQKFKDPQLALAAYNGGPGTVDRAVNAAIRQGLKPTWQNVRQFITSTETKNYPGKVLGAYSQIVKV